MEFKEPHKDNQPCRLEDFEFEMPRLATDEEPEVADDRTFKVVFNGITLDLNIENVSKFDEYGGCHLSLKVKVDKERLKNIANIEIEFDKRKDEEWKAYTNVFNGDRNISGLGRTLWEVSLKLIQKFTDKWDVSVTHTIMRIPKNGLSFSKWNELFFPLLDKYGYAHGEGELYTWERAYLPNKQ